MISNDAPTLGHKGPWIALNEYPSPIDSEKRPATVRKSRRRKRLKIVILFVSAVAFVAVVIVLVTVLLRRTIITETVDLGYAQYRGRVLPNSDVKAWLGMRYAAAPVGDLRFAAAQDPVTVNGTQDAFKHGKTCLSVDDNPPVDGSTSEDCLFIDVYAPAAASWESHLPVFFFIQGGGFASNANANYDGRGLIHAAESDMIVVTFNYRVGLYGFLAGSEVDSPNNGLKDQRKALQWVRQHITKFGGNPEHIVLGGDSAGGASVALQMAAYGGTDTGLFHAAALESPSFATMLKNSEAQYLYDAVVEVTSCFDQADTLACLRGLSSDDMQRANHHYAYPSAAGPPVFAWNPVIDGDLIRDYPYSAFSKGNFVKVPVIVGDDTNGGTVFAPRDTDTLDQSNTFLKNTFPYLNGTHIDKINEFYPNDPADAFPDAGAYWRRTANAYGELRYMCPSIFLAAAIQTYGNLNGTQSWAYRYNVQDSEQMARGLGVPHTIEIAAIWGPDNVDHDSVPNSYWAKNANSAIVPMMQGYWSSFIRTFDPNVHRYEATPEWASWDTELTTEPQGFLIQGGQKKRLLLDTPVNSTAMEVVDSGLWQRCQYFWSIGADLRQ